MQITEQHGLLITEHGADHASVLAALREHDSELRLIPQESESRRAIYWTVVRRVGGDRPVEIVCRWMNEAGDPLPLSHRLVDLVKTLDPSERAHELYVDPDVANARMREELRREEIADMDTAIEEAIKREGRHPVLHRSVGLRRARDRARARGENV